MALSPQDRATLVQGLSEQDQEDLYYCWGIWARDSQIEPDGEWRYWLLMAGRGFGKSRTGAEWAIAQARRRPKSRGALIARTAGDVRDVMVEGESGILAVSPPSFRPRYEPSKRRLVWPNGSMATTYTGDEPDAMRGPQHHWGWCDELASWRYPEAWDMFLFGLRLGDDPRAVITTTPRPVKHIRELIGDPGTVVTRGSTYENRGNLAPAFLDKIVRKYEGSRLGRQELLAELLDDNPDALWTRACIDRNRVKTPPDELARIVVGVDPAVSSGEEADDTGIIVAGAMGFRGDAHGYVIDDRTCHDTPHGWATAAVNAYREYKADCIVAEANQGGEMVRHTIQTIDRYVPVKLVHASRGKRTRAEPISTLYEQGRVHHVGDLSKLEDEMCDWVPGGDADSPDRMDAAVWALTELMVEQESGRRVTVSLRGQRRG